MLGAVFIITNIGSTYMRKNIIGTARSEKGSPFLTFCFFGTIKKIEFVIPNEVSLKKREVKPWRIVNW